MGKALFVLKHLIHSFLVVDDLAIHCYDIFLLFINLELCYGFVMSCVIVTLNLLLTGSNFPFLAMILYIHIALKGGHVTLKRYLQPQMF